MEEDNFFRCQCHTHMLEAYYDQEGDEVYLSFWEQGQASNKSNPWRYRLRHIWRIIKDGTPYADNIVLSKSESQQLEKWLHNKGISKK